MHQEPNVGFDPGSPGSRPGPKAGAKLLRHPGIPTNEFLIKKKYLHDYIVLKKNQRRERVPAELCWCHTVLGRRVFPLNGRRAQWPCTHGQPLLMKFRKHKGLESEEM